jgi:hypothetical protein
VRPPSIPIIALLALTVLVAVLAIGSMREDSATADEAAHIAAGLLKVREGRIDIYATQTPLIEALIAAPLALTGHRVPDEWRRFGNRPWVAGHMLLYRAGYDSQRILRMARLPAIALLLALCFAVWGFVRDATGDDAAAVGAFALTGFCPTLLAHGRLATVDLGVTLFAFLATMLLLRLLRTPSMGVAVATGIAVACTLASKVSGALLVPFFAIVVVLWFVRERRVAWRMLAVAALTSVATFILIYLLIARSIDLTLPFRAYLDEVRAVREFYVANPLPQFLLGEFSQDGWPHYYLVAIAVKTPLPALALFVLAGVASIRRRRFEVIVCAIFATLFLVVSAFSSLNLGIRHVLPIYPFLYAACAIALFDVSRRMRIAAAVLVVAQALTAVVAYPSYLSYFNPLIGSARNADRILIDSNLDWGQDLRRLGHWTRDHDIDAIHVHYFGAGNVERELGSRGIRWAAPRPEPLPQGWFAVSRHYYRLSFLPARSPVDYDTYLRASGARYVTTIGGSIDVYRVTGPRR